MERNLKPVSLKPLKQHFFQTHETPLFSTLTTRKCHAMCNDAHLKQCVQRAPSSAGGMWPLTEIRLHETSGLRPAPGPSRALHLQYLILECPIDAGAAMAGSVLRYLKQIMVTDGLGGAEYLLHISG